MKEGREGEREKAAADTPPSFLPLFLFQSLRKRSPVSSTSSTLAKCSLREPPSWPRRNSLGLLSSDGGVRTEISLSFELVRSGPPSHELTSFLSFASFVRFVAVTLSGAVWIDRKRSKNALQVMAKAGDDMKKKGVSSTGPSTSVLPTSASPLLL